MNYQKHYNVLISRARRRVIEGYCEKHHVVPRCLGGDDCPDNLVNLTPEEHYVAHQLLVKMYPNHAGLKYALYLMSRSTKKMKRKNKEYGWIKRRLVEASRAHQVERMKSTKVRQRLSESTRKWWESRTPEQRIEISEKRSKNQKGAGNSFYGKKHNSETRKRLSDYRKSVYQNMTEADYQQHPQTVSVSIEGIVYHGLGLAGRHHNIGPSLVRYRCLSKTERWKSWYYI